MPKYIDADALRKRMEQIAEESKPAVTARPMREDTPSELLRYGTARAMIEWLNEIPAADVEPKQRWIPVTERLPEEWHIVMTYQPTPSWMEDGIGLRRTAVYIGNGKWREAEKHNMMELPVTHWMPLPEPPKGEKED